MHQGSINHKSQKTIMSVVNPGIYVLIVSFSVVISMQAVSTFWKSLDDVTIQGES